CSLTARIRCRWRATWRRAPASSRAPRGLTRLSARKRMRPMRRPAPDPRTTPAPLRTATTEDRDMRSFPNIETRLLNGKRIGYAASTGQATRIYGDYRNGYRVAGKYCRTLAEVSAHLSTL